MKKIKYISLKTLKDNLVKVIDSVYQEEIEYIVMVDKTPKVRLSAVKDDKGKKIYVEEKLEENNLKRFVN
jgi:hypothetical protein